MFDSFTLETFLLTLKKIIIIQQIKENLFVATLFVVLERKNNKQKI